MTKISIYIYDIQGKSIRIEVDLNETISDGKRKYKITSNSSDSNFIWKFNGEILKNDKTFEYYDIEDDDRILSVIPNMGGGHNEFYRCNKKHIIDIRFFSETPEYRKAGKGISFK